VTQPVRSPDHAIEIWVADVCSVTGVDVVHLRRSPSTDSRGPLPLKPRVGLRSRSAGLLLGKFGVSMTTTQAGARATAHDELVEQLDAHVREVVRREGVDPQWPRSVA